MPIKSLNESLLDLQGSDSLTPQQKQSLLDMYNANFPTLQKSQLLGYKSIYGNEVSVNRSSTAIHSTGTYYFQGQERIVRMSNGWLVAVVVFSQQHDLMVSKDNGTTWSRMCYYVATQTGGCSSIAAVDNMIYWVAKDSDSIIRYLEINTLTQTNVQVAPTGVLESNLTYVNDLSLTHNPIDNTLHVAYSGRTSGLLAVFTRYSKGSIQANKSIKWGTVTIIGNSVEGSGLEEKYQNIVIVNGQPVIIVTFKNGGNYFLMCNRYTGTSWVNNIQIIGSSTYEPQYIDVAVDSNNVIHVVFCAKDSIDVNPLNIRYTKSTDFGVTWVTPIKLTSGNSYPQTKPKIVCDKDNNLYVYFEGATATSNGYYNIRKITYTSSWSAISEITTSSTAHFMNVQLCKNHKVFTTPLMLWYESVGPTIKFNGVWTDKPITSEINTHTAVVTEQLLDAIIAQGKVNNHKKYAFGSGTSAANYVLTVTGLAFKPSYIILYSPTVGSWNWFQFYDSRITAGASVAGDSSYNPQSFAFAQTTSILADGFAITTRQPSAAFKWVAFE